jgi:hypothetical protein
MLAIDMDAIAIPEDIIRSTNHRHPPRLQIVPADTFRNAGQEECGDIDFQVEGVLP